MVRRLAPARRRNTLPPGPPPYPARDDYVAYLQEYAAGMRLRLGTRVHRIDRTDGSSCAPDAVICATGYRPGIEALAGHLVTLDRRGMPPFIGAASSPECPGLWFFGLDSSIYGNMQVHRRQARRLACAIAR